MITALTVLDYCFPDDEMRVGAENSNFVVPDGYDADGQYTTGYDLAVIVKACLDDSCISEIVVSYSSYERWPNGREVTYNNTNELLNPNKQPILSIRSNRPKDGNQQPRWRLHRFCSGNPGQH